MSIIPTSHTGKRIAVSVWAVPEDPQDRTQKIVGYGVCLGSCVMYQTNLGSFYGTAVEMPSGEVLYVAPPLARLEKESDEMQAVLEHSA